MCGRLVEEIVGRVEWVVSQKLFGVTSQPPE
jgi:hypothetical protein